MKREGMKSKLNAPEHVLIFFLRCAKKITHASVLVLVNIIPDSLTPMT